jgi:hypothetical protein
MTPIIAALFGMIAMAYAKDYPNQEATTRQLQLPPTVPDDVAKRFKERSQVKDDVQLKLQDISNGLPFVFDGKEISYGDGDVDVINVFTSDAKVVVDGASQTPLSQLSTSKKDSGILIVKDTTGKLISVIKTDKTTGTSTELLPVSKFKGGKTFATVTSDDFDVKKLELFRMEDIMPPDETRRLRGHQVHDFVDASNHLAIDDDHRSLQEGCGSFDVIKVALVIDSSLCAYAGGSSEVNALSQKIVDLASNFYEVPGLCKKLEISYLEIHCDPNTDPIEPILSQAGTSDVCGALESFAGYVSSKGINGDVTHLFHGKDFTGTTTIGCAYIGTLCNTDGYNTGVNQISFSESLPVQSKLVAHENGHICSANHTSDTSDVMYKNICAGSCSNVFGQTSKNFINSKVDSTSCTSVENIPTLSPVSSPSASPIAVPTGTPTLPAPSGSPIAVPTGTPTPPAPTGSPIEAPICEDDPSFRFQWKKSVEDCNYVAGLSNGYISKVCGEDFVGDACRVSCGNCP